MVRKPPTKAQLAEMAQAHIYYEVAMLRGGLAEQDRLRNQYPELTNRFDRADPRRIECMAFFEAALLMHAY
jgi:hypothetical protein